MADFDEIMRAYARISSIKENIPDSYVVSKVWVIEYHEALDKVEEAVGKSLSEFKVPGGSVKCMFAPERTYSPTRYDEESGEPINYLTSEGTNRVECDRSVLLQKVDAVLTYLRLLLRPEERKIGF